MRILHTEGSNGWGGQEIRILKEAEGMRERGHEVIFAVVGGGKLAEKAREKGFIVYEMPFKKILWFRTIPEIMSIIGKHKVDIVNTHSSSDAWLAGFAAKFKRRKIIRTRHLSTPIRKGFNSILLYRFLADFVVTTSSGIIPMIVSQAKISKSRCACIATGVDPLALQVPLREVESFRSQWGITKDDFLIGTVCVVRSWKGIKDFIEAANLLRSTPNLKWIIVGGGYLDEYKPIVEELKLTSQVIFTGHLPSPQIAIRSLDTFALLSTAHEGISQASLQAAYLERALITTSVGGLPEVCIDGVTGYVVPPFSPKEVADCGLKLKNNPSLREERGRKAKMLVETKFTMTHMLDAMEEIYSLLSKRRK